MHFTKKEKKIVGLFVSVLMLIIFTFGIWYLKFYQNYSIINNSPQSAKAGTRQEMKFQIDGSYRPKEVKFIYKEGDEEKELNMSERTGNYSTKINTKWGQENLEYKFKVDKKTFPSDGFYNLELSSDNPITFDFNKITQTLDSAEFENGDLKFSINIPEDFQIADLKLEFLTTLDANQKPIDYQIKYENENFVVESVHVENTSYSIAYRYKFTYGDKEYELPEDGWYGFRRTEETVSNSLDDLRKDLQSIVDKEKIYVSYEDEFGDKWTSGDVDKDFISLSLIKTFVMIEAYNQLDQGKISKSDRVSRYGYSNTVEGAIKHMIQVSSNEATGSLILKLGISNINNTIKKYLGNDTKTILRHTPGYMFKEGAKDDNMTTAHDLETTMKLLYEGKIVSEDASKEMYEIMRGTSDYFSVKQYTGEGKLISKTGYIDREGFGIMSAVETDKGTFFVGIYVDAWDGGSAVPADVRKAFEKVYNYHSEKEKVIYPKL